jgi:hypothetical protein
MGRHEGRIASRRSLLDGFDFSPSWMCSVATASRDPLIATRASPQTKARFAALAAAQGRTESALLLALIDTVLANNAASDEAVCPVSVASQRISLRLRPGDRALVDERARARRMKSASYLVALIRAHVRSTAPLPATELDALKVTANHLSALRSTLHAIAHSRGASLNGDQELLDCLHETVAVLEAVRREVSDVVRTNLMSWEACDA